MLNSSALEWRKTKRISAMNITHNEQSSTLEWLDVFGPQIKFLTADQDGKDDYVLIMSIVGPGVIVPLHSHEDRETMVMISGDADAYVDGEWISLSKGDHIDIGSQVPHAWRNVSNAPAEILLVTTANIERFFREIGRKPLSISGPPTPDELGKLFEASDRYGYWMGSPEENAKIGLNLQPPV
ncbi:cupin domain-containing protein [Rhizobium leguminosarum]|uniref:cupin domain-containing protein n=1 Tax=Rhizobium leguminosarum TaxID=384 RepID=UPI003F9929EE